MEEFTKAQKTMVHLYKYRYTDIEYGSDAPFELTQDWIDEALGISRSYTSLIIGRMDKGETARDQTDARDRE